MVSDESVPCQIMSGKHSSHTKNQTGKKIKSVGFGSVLCNTWVVKTGSTAL